MRCYFPVLPGDHVYRRLTFASTLLDMSLNFLLICSAMSSSRRMSMVIWYVRCCNYLWGSTLTIFTSHSERSH